MTQAQQMAKILESMLVKLKADKQHSDAAISILEKELAALNKYKEEFDVAMEKFEKKMAKLRRREVLTKKLNVDKFKAS